MISYREKEMMMVMKFLADHSNEFANQLTNNKYAMANGRSVDNLVNKLPEVSDYQSLVEYVKNSGYDTTLRINDLLSDDELEQLEKEYKNIEKEFANQTGLNKTDVVFIVTAVILQMIRQFLQPKLDFESFKGKDSRKYHDKTASDAKKSSYDSDQADKKLKKAENDKTKGSKYYHASLKEIADIAHVPYDVINGTKKYNVKLSGTNHRFKTLGHDPWLGYIFGTCNILTNTMTLGKENQFRTLHIGKDTFGKPSAIAEGDLLKMFEYSIKRYNESHSTVGLAIMKQVYHIKSDEYSKEGISLPFLQLIFDSDVVQNLCESGIDYAKLDFLGSVAKQTAFAEIINYIISVAHRVTILCEENKQNLKEITKEQLLMSLKKTKSLNEVRTRKVIMISNCIATSVNAIVIGGVEVAAAFTNNEKLAEEAINAIDIGGYISTILHLFMDIRFITKIKKDFIAQAIENNYKEKLTQLY